MIKLKSSNTLFVGDTHGDFDSTIIIVRKFLEANYDHIVFLGDYIDRGIKQIENINYVLALKLLHPQKVILLRGNHETPAANKNYGFYHQVVKELGELFYNLYSTLFSKLPNACLVNNKVLALHGGLAEGLQTIEQLENLPKDKINVTDPMLLQILWNDPGEGIHGFYPNMRGIGIMYFGEDVYDEFARNNGIKYMIRAHEVFPAGYYHYFGGKILSIFSARNYGIKIDAKVALHDTEDKLEVLSVK